MQWFLPFTLHDFINYSFDNNTGYNNINPIYMKSLPCARPWYIPQIYKMALQKHLINWIFNRDFKKKPLLFIWDSHICPLLKQQSGGSDGWVAISETQLLSNNWGANETQDCQRFVIDKQGATEALKGQTSSSCWKVMLWAWVRVNWCHSYPAPCFLNRREHST